MTPVELGFLYRAIGLLFLIGITLSIAAAVNDSITRASVKHTQRIRRLNRYADRDTRERTYRSWIG